MGRKPSFPIKELSSFFLEEKESIVVNGKVTSRSDPVWQRLSDRMKNIHIVSAPSLQVLVSLGRYNLHSLLGIELVTKCDDGLVEEGEMEETSSASEYETSFNALQTSSSSSSVDSLSFIMTLSDDEWRQIAPVDLQYQTKRPSGQPFFRSYRALHPNKWTNIIHCHFYKNTRLPCRMVYSGGKEKQTPPYIKITGTCSHCLSHFNGSISHKPAPNSHVQIHCTFQGNFNSSHPSSKRPLRGELRVAAGKTLVDRRMAPSTYRSLEANKIMNFGDREPAHVPKPSALRNAKCEELKRRHRSDNPLFSVLIMKHEAPFSSFIRDVTVEKVCIPFYSNAQVHSQRLHCKKGNSKMSIDASGGVVVHGSGRVFLYESVINNGGEDGIFPVCSMLSERHDTETIRHWLEVFIRDGGCHPKEIVLDMSLALMAACVKVFTGFKSVNAYLDFCVGRLLLKSGKTGEVPFTFIRNDVAHVMKLFASLPCLKQKTVVRRTRQFYLRCLAQLIQSTNISDARTLILHIFIVALSESQGTTTDGDTSPVDSSKRFLLDRIATGQVIPDEVVDYSDREDPDDSYAFAHEQLLQSPAACAYGKVVTFSSWADDIETEARDVIVDGNDGNQQFLPKLVADLKRLIALLPFWTGVMVPIYGFGESTASSAESETNFFHVKHIHSRHLVLPTRIDDFLENYINVLSGRTKLEMARQHESTLPQTHEQERSSSESKSVESPVSRTDAASAPQSPQSSQQESHVSEMKITDDHISPPRSSESADADGQKEKQVQNDHRDLPSHSSSSADADRWKETTKAEFHATDTSTVTPKNVPGSRRKRKILLLDEIICEDCVYSGSNIEKPCENHAQEDWGGLIVAKKSRKNSYLDPSNDYAATDLTTMMKQYNVAHLKNGNNSQLKPINSNGRSLCLENTCSFDSVVQILSAAYCESPSYKKFVNSSKDAWPAANLIIIMTSEKKNYHSIYTERAKILEPHFLPSMTFGSVATLQCESSAVQMASIIVDSVPSASFISKCSSPQCPQPRHSYQDSVISVNRPKDSLRKLKEAVAEHLQPEASTCLKGVPFDAASSHQIFDVSLSKTSALCTGTRTKESSISSGHLLLEVIDQNSEKVVECKCSLKDFPTVLLVSSKFYHLRGIIAFRGTQRAQVTSMGHYVAYVRRGGNDHWEIHDDLKSNVEKCSGSAAVRSHIAIYTV